MAHSVASRDAEMLKVLDNISFDFGGKLRRNIRILLALGVAGLAWGFLSGHVLYVAQALLINTLFFAGIAHAGLMFSVIFTVTDAFWGRPMKRISEAMAGFAPIGALLFVVLFFFTSYLFEWTDHDKVIHSKEGWLNLPFFTIRNVLLVGLLGVLSYLYLKASVKPDILLARKLKGADAFNNGLANRLVGEAGDFEAVHADSYHYNKQLAPWLGFTYALVCTLIAFDWVSSIDQEWFSTMFGVQYLVANLIGAGAVLIIFSGVFREKFQISEYQTLLRHHDFCKLTFAFTLLWTYMIFSQVIVIWYANIPEETPYMVLRMLSEEWGWMFWVLFVAVFQIPFWGLLSRTACRSIYFSRLIAVELLCGLWLEKYFLVTPSVQENLLDSGHGDSHGQGLSSETVAGFEPVPFLIDLLVGCGFLGLFIISFLAVSKKIPMMAISDYRLFKPSH